MRHFRAEEEPQGQQVLQKLTFQQQLEKSLKTLTKLLLFVEFTVNYGYAIENSWVTMLMITHDAPDEVDSFIWITPIVIAALIRPYIIRYVHQVTHKVYRQISMVSFFLFVGAIGCYIVGLSCSMGGKKQHVKRLVTCTIGWTLMDISFELCQFFAEKIEEKYTELQEMESRSEEGKSRLGEPQTFGKKDNFEFYGLLLGYIVSILICWIVHGRTVKAFYRCCKYAYWTVGGLSLITSIRVYIEGQMSLPRLESEDKPEGSIFPIETQVSFYLPGLFEFVRAETRTFLLLLLHGVIVFQNDIVMVYATMWFTEPDNYNFSKHGEALIAGLQYGSLALLLYTMIDGLKINSRYLFFPKSFEMSLFLMLVVSISCFFVYNYYTFFFVCCSIGIANQFYRHMVYNHQSENNPVFQRCIQIVERAEKIFVFAVMPPIIMLILERDDIRDCLLWFGGMSMVALGLYLKSVGLSKKGEEEQKSSQTKKVTKIQ